MNNIDHGQEEAREMNGENKMFCVFQKEESKD